MSKVTAIIGATSDLGESVAQYLHYRQKPLLLVGRNSEKLQNLCSRLDNKHASVLCDFDDLQKFHLDYEDLIAKSNTEVESVIFFTGLDKVRPIASTPISEYQRLMQINCLSPISVFKILTKHKKTKSSLKNVVFISSVATERAFKGKSAYTAAKAALEGFAKVAAVEFAGRISVNIICLGSVRTTMFNKNPLVKNDPDYFKNNYPMGEPDLASLGETIAKFVNGTQNWMTGQRIIIDGGRSVS